MKFGIFKWDIRYNMLRITPSFKSIGLGIQYYNINNTNH